MAFRCIDRSRCNEGKGEDWDLILHDRSEAGLTMKEVICVVYLDDLGDLGVRESF